jgi:hypothetical protein
MGSLYRRGKVWWVKYYANGRSVRESTEITGDSDTPPAEAKRFLKVREGKAASGEPVIPRLDRLRYEEIRKDLLEHYATTGRRDADEVGWRLKHLDKFFAGRRVAQITDALVTTYVAQRQEQGASNATINRELATIRPMMRLAYKHRKASRLLLVERLKESAPRAGFFEDDQYKAVVRRLPADLQVVAAIAHRFGWRVRSEIVTLERRHLDLKAGTLRLEPGAWAGSSRTYSRTSRGASAWARARVCHAPRSTRRGRAPAARPASWGGSRTTSAGRPSATWSAPASRARSLRN